jgi:16S rRNA (cytidine1402-2'-O)-methyltransferase
MSETIQAGALYVVSTPIGNLADISARAVQVLSGVDLIAAEDTRTSRILLQHLDIAKPLVSFFAHNETRRVPELIEKLRAGSSVALITDAGTPGISDPAFSIVRGAIASHIRVIAVPGASALLAALVTSGLPMDRFVFEGFLPVKKGRQSRLKELQREERTIVLYESPHRLCKTLDDLLQAFGDRQIVVAREMTKHFEEIVRGTITTVRETFRAKEPRGEFVIVVAGFDPRVNRREKNPTEELHGKDGQHRSHMGRHRPSDAV